MFESFSPSVFSTPILSRRCGFQDAGDAAELLLPMAVCRNLPLSRSSSFERVVYDIHQMMLIP
jgi:hypothetical protein